MSETDRIKVFITRDESKKFLSASLLNIDLDLFAFTPRNLAHLNV